MQHEDFPGGHPSYHAVCPYLTITEPKKQEEKKTPNRFGVASVPLFPFRCPVNGRRAPRGGVGQLKRSWSDARATSYLGSDLRTRPTNSRFEGNGAASKTHCVAMTYGLFRASDIGSWENKDSQMNKTTESKRPRQLKRQKDKKKGCNTRTSQEVTHPTMPYAPTSR
ncbi:unnamed protein product [Prunus brigantina]